MVEDIVEILRRFNFMFVELLGIENNVIMGFIFCYIIVVM